MTGTRPKLTRRRGACEECRQRKVRCDGANPCNHCQRNESLCEYNIRRSRRRGEEKSTQNQTTHLDATTQPHATTGNMELASSEEDHPSGVDVGQDAESLENPLNTPFSEGCFSQLMTDSTHTYLDFDFLDETIPGIDQVQIIDSGQQESSFQNQMPYYTRNDTPMLDWLKLGSNQNLHHQNATQICDLAETEQYDGSIERRSSIFAERIVADQAETKLFSPDKMYRITALFQNADRGSRRQLAIIDKVKVLLSSDHQPCLSSLLRKMESGKERQSLGLSELPMKRLVQRAFKEPGGPGLFIKEQDVALIQERFLDPKNLPIDASDMSLLIVSLAWGALLEPEISSSSRVALLDAVLETSTVLLRQHRSVRQFLALVAILCLSEKTGSDNLSALMLGSISTAVSLSLHLEPVLCKSCASEEQAIQVRRATWLLYCIDKSYALRWHTFSLVGDSSLPTTNPPERTLDSDSATTVSLEWIQIRSQYAKICSKILQLRVGAEENTSEDHSNRATELLVALEEWYTSDRTSKMISSLGHSDAMRVKLHISNQYYEARFHLLSIRMLDSKLSSPAASQECRELLKQSTREIITCFSTIPSEYLLQDCNYLFIGKLALCLLALDILLEPDDNGGKENRTFLSIVAGFFARMGILFPETSVLDEVSDLIEILTYR